MPFDHFFQLGPVPNSVMEGSYSFPLVALSYFIASLASFVALDITQRMRSEEEDETSFKFIWLILGAITMGLGIWTMHFIGMLAYMLPMPMQYELPLTALSLFAAIVASGLAFFLVMNKSISFPLLFLGGTLMGIGICSMHYLGMAAMLHVQIAYWPGLFFLSFFIAVTASQAALWLMTNSNKLSEYRLPLLKLATAMVMGLAICGMHYTGMAAAVITETETSAMQGIDASSFNVNTLSLYLAGTTLFIMGIAFGASRYRIRVFQIKNKKLIETEKILEQKTRELENLNIHLMQLAESSLLREDRIRTILLAAPDGIFLVDEMGNIEMCNQAAADILGYSIKEIKGKNIHSFIGLAKNEKEFLSLPFSSLVKNEDPLLERVGWHKSNYLVPLELSIAKSSSTNNPSYILVIRDITPRKKAEQEVAKLNFQLLSTARLAGMAEVAAGVLHNVGNVLTSINVSSQVLLDRNERFNITGFMSLAELINAHKNHLDTFIMTDPIGKMLPDYLKELSNYLQNEAAFFKSELEDLNNKVQHIKEIIASQRLLGVSSTLYVKANINQMIDDALKINVETIEKNHIQIKKDYQDMPFINIDHIKMMQALVNLIKNAIESVLESENEEKNITIRTRHQESQCKIEIMDNGIGIDPKNLTKIFSYGFTTKSFGHGFGLHTSALSIQEMGGMLQADSKGKNLGATFSITLPIN